MLDRISQLLKGKKISASQFADAIGVQRSSVSHVLSGRNKPSLDFATKIIITYPEINADWLLSGKGDMLKVENRPDEDISQRDPQTRIEMEHFGEESTEVTEKLPVKATEVAKKRKTGSRISATGSKTIDKTVFFYQDGTFSEYVPED